MKNMKKILILVVLFSGFAASSFAQGGTATTNASSHAQIISPITILKTQDMEFGNLAVSASLGTAVIDNADGLSVTGGVSKVGVTASKSAAFTVTGQASTAYSVTLPPSTITLTGPSGTMILWNFTSNCSGNTGGTGINSFKVGATLNVAGSQDVGNRHAPFVHGSQVALHFIIGGVDLIFRDLVGRIEFKFKGAQFDINQAFEQGQSDLKVVLEFDAQGRDFFRR